MLTFPSIMITYFACKNTVFFRLYQILDAKTSIVLPFYTFKANFHPLLLFLIRFHRGKLFEYLRTVYKVKRSTFQLCRKIYRFLSEEKWDLLGRNLGLTWEELAVSCKQNALTHYFHIQSKIMPLGFVHVRTSAFSSCNSYLLI